MCGRFTLNLAELADLKLPLGLDAIEITDWYARYNIAPTQTAPAATQNGSRVLRPMRWGLVPRWAKDPSVGNRLINARVESLADKPSFRTPLQSRRCIVPATGFFEWRVAGSQDVAASPRRSRRQPKQPMWIHRTDDAPLLLAGLWDRWRSPEGESLDSFTIITTTASTFMASIHDRMPLILAHDADRESWLRLGPMTPSRLDELTAHTGLVPLTAHPVDHRMNATAVDDPHCIAVANEQARATEGEPGSERHGRQLGLFD